MYMLVSCAVVIARYNYLAVCHWCAVADHEWWLCPLLLFIFLALTPLWCFISHRNKYVHEVLYEGWTPVIGAMVISRSVARAS